MLKPPRYALLATLLLLPIAPGTASGTEAPPALTVTDATVSLLEPAAGQCEWAQLDPLSSSRRVLARLAVDCQGGATALSRDGLRGAVRFWRGGVSMPVLGKPTFPERFPSHEFRDRLFAVELSTGASEELPLPPLGELVDFGFDPSGQLLGLTLQYLTPAQEQARAAEVDGTVIPLEHHGPGHLLLAHAFAFQGGRWVRLESQASTDTLGPSGLRSRKELGVRSSRALDPRFKSVEIEDDALLDQLYALSPEQPDGEWTTLKIGGYTLAIWGTPFGEDTLATGLLRLVERSKAVALPKCPYRSNDQVSLQSRGPFLLLSLADSGGHPRLYRGKKLVWSSETARAVTFWPR